MEQNKQNKILYLTRHASSDQNLPDQSDFERSLNTLGKKEAAIAGQMLLNEGLTLDWVISSPAFRAIETAEIILKESMQNDETILETNDLIYTNTYHHLIRVIHQIPAQYQTVMLVGHNPSLTHAANLLANEMVSDMSTASIYAIEFYVNDWQAANIGLGKRLFYWAAKK